MTGAPHPAALLKWYLEAGADEAISETPQDRFAQSQVLQARALPAQAPETPPEPPPTAVKSSPPPTAAPKPASKAPVTPIAADAAASAAACRTLDELVEAIHAFDGCALKETAANTVIRDGNPQARLMVIGEAPGAEEDRRGLPFVGPAGTLLDRMLAAIDLDRETVLITNIVFWRPPGNRNPSADEIAACLPFARRQIELVRPQVLVAVGGIAAKALFETSEGITRLRGKWRDYTSPGLESPIAAMATFHPAYLLRQPLQKREAWQDLLAIKAKLDETSASA